MVRQIGRELTPQGGPRRVHRLRFRDRRCGVDGRRTAAAARRHFHKTFSEAFFVLSGTVEFYNGESWTSARPGDFLYVPMGGVHGFRAPGDEPSSMLILFAPGAPREGYFRELSAIRDDGRTLTEDEWTEFLARHDQYSAE